MDPDLMQLRYLIALDRERNFTRAATACHVTQQSLSAGIARLEQLLGARLVIRTTRRVELTDAGRLLAERAAVALDEIAAAVTDARAVAQGRGGRLVLGFHGAGADVAAPLLTAFAAAHPDVRVDLRRADFAEPSAGVLEDAAGAAVVPFPIEHPELESVPLVRERHMFVLASDHRLADRDSIGLDELGDEELETMANPTGDELIAQWCRYWTLAEHRPGSPIHEVSFSGVEEWLAIQRRSRHASTGPESAQRMYPAGGIVYVPARGVPPVIWRLIYPPAALSPQAARLVETARSTI